MAGVSIGTVDRVIHNRGKVSPQAREKVMQILKQFNYKPNLLARSLSRSKKIKVAILTPESGHDEYWKKTSEGLSHEMEKWGHHRVIFSVFQFDLVNHQHFANQLGTAIQQQPDGIVLAPIHYQESHDLLADLASKMPLALFNSNMADLKPLTFIGQDLFKSGRVAANLVHKNSAKPGEILIIHTDEDLADSPHLKEKEDGFRNYFNEIDGSYFVVKSLVISDKENDYDSVLNHAITPSTVGLFITTSNGTSLVSQAVEKLGRSDLIIVGYDLLENNVRFLKNGVTSYLINQNPHLLGSTALSYLLENLLNNKTVPNQELFPIDIVTRENVDSYLKFQSSK